MRRTGCEGQLCSDALEVGVAMYALRSKQVFRQDPEELKGKQGNT